MWRLSVIKYNIADFLPDAKISNHAFKADVLNLTITALKTVDAGTVGSAMLTVCPPKPSE